MGAFSVETESISLPRGATPAARRTKVRWRGKAITVLAQGSHRAYLFPVYTPQGVPVTDESPIDHPHHNSITIGADHFACHFPPLLPDLSDRPELAAYNFYVNETFQGRAPGRIWVTSIESREISDDHLRVVQTLEWQGPVEWGAPERRLLGRETRTIDVRPGERANVIDLRSQLRAAEWDVTIGPTRHAYFTIRLAEGLRAIDGGRLIDSEGRAGAAEISGKAARWVDCSGPGPHGCWAGIAAFPFPSVAEAPWIVFDWGTLTLNPFLREARTLRRGESLDLGLRVVAHDGDAADAGVAELHERFVGNSEPTNGTGAGGGPLPSNGGSR